MKSIRYAMCCFAALSLLPIVAILMTSCATVHEETLKVSGITIKPGYPLPNDAATLKESVLKKLNLSSISELIEYAGAQKWFTGQEEIDKAKELGSLDGK